MESRHPALTIERDATLDSVKSKLHTVRFDSRFLRVDFDAAATVEKIFR